MEFSRQGYWSGLLFPSPRDLPDPGMEPVSPDWQVDPLPLRHHGNPYILYICVVVAVVLMGFPGGSAGKESACNAGDEALILGSGRSLGEGNSSPLQYSCLGNPMDRGACWAPVHGVTKSQTRLGN